MQRLLQRARAAGRFGIDTEFIGEGRYRTMLCLIQLVVSDEEGLEILVVDALQDDLDLSPLAAVLADPEVEVVVHAGRQDIALLRRYARTEVTHIFDTQLAAGFAGIQAQAGYETLLRELLGLSVQKSASYTRWDRRPLTAEQMEYAREDVLHLLEMATELERRLGANGRLAWAREECRALEAATDSRDPELLWSKLPRVNGLKPQARAIARELVEWRESVAERQNRPASTVLNDSALVELAKRAPANLQQLEAIRGVNAGNLRRRGEDLIEAIARGESRQPIAAEPIVSERGSPLDAPLIALCEALVRARVLEAKLAYELVASRADLQRLVAAARGGGAEAGVRTLQGWRRALVGEELLELLAGELVLQVGEDRRLSVERPGRA
ncbi:MAG: ribonuclease D [Solirubrobacteraceae bacterium]